LDDVHKDIKWVEYDTFNDLAMQTFAWYDVETPLLVVARLNSLWLCG
jgi:hypothetical protein